MRLTSSALWLRHTSHGRDPRIRPSSRPKQPLAARDRRRRLYLADGETTMWAEWYRSLAELGIPPMHQLPRDVWRYRVRACRGSRPQAPKIALIASASRRPRPGGRRGGRIRRVGEQLWREGWAGLVAPSAARPEGLVLCVFVRRSWRATRPADSAVRASCSGAACCRRPVCGTYIAARYAGKKPSSRSRRRRTGGDRHPRRGRASPPRTRVGPRGLKRCLKAKSESSFAPAPPPRWNSSSLCSWPQTAAV